LFSRYGQEAPAAFTAFVEKLCWFADVSASHGAQRHVIWHISLQHWLYQNTV
jgi:hypothetical protein